MPKVRKKGSNVFYDANSLCASKNLMFRSKRYDPIFLKQGKKNKAKFKEADTQVVF